MARPLSRRSLLQAATVITAGCALPQAATGRAAAAPASAAGTPAAWTVRPFGLEDVSLGQGVFADKRKLMLDHARGYDVNRLLEVFRANAGLATGGTVAPGGWEGLDGEANGNLRGHYTGHFLTMLAQAYRGTKEQVFADRIGTMAGALTEVRAALRRDPAVLSVTGKFGTAADQVRGSYQYVDLPAAVLGGAAAITLSVRVRPAHEADWARILDFGDEFPGDRQRACAVRESATGELCRRVPGLAGR